MYENSSTRKVSFKYTHGQEKAEMKSGKVVDNSTGGSTKEIVPRFQQY